MVKKNNKILVGCLALLLVMAVGYALFSETITINGTATAKGEFDVDVSCEKGLNSSFLQNEEYITDGFRNSALYDDNRPIVENNYKNDSCTVNGNSVSFSAELTQPEASRIFTVKITNNGTMDAYLDLFESFENSSGYKTCYGDYDTGEFTKCENRDSVAGNLIDFNILGFEYKNGTLIKAINGEEKVSDFAIIDFDNGILKITLEPGESMYLGFQAAWFYLGWDIESSNKALQQQELTVDFNFKQPTTN